MKIARYPLLLMLILLLTAAPASGAAKYRVTEILLPPGVSLYNPHWFGQLVAINNQGVVAGWYTASSPEAYRWENGVLTVLPKNLLEETNRTEAYAINNQGQIAGVAANSSGSEAPCIWQGAPPYTPTALPDGGTRALGLNDLDHAVGNIGSAAAVRWKDSVRTMLPNLAPGNGSNAFDINQNGAIVGYSYADFGSVYWPVLWRDDGEAINITNLGDFVENPIPNRGGAALAINDLSQVVGWALANYEDYDFGVWRAFLWEEGSGKTNLGALYAGGNSCALAINNAGQIVGYSSTNVPPYGNRAILWEKGALIDLNTRIDPIPNWYLREAQAINDRGQIVCLAESYDGLNRWIYLLTPVSSLPAYLLLLD